MPVNRPLADVADALIAVVLAPRCAACAIPLESPTRGPVCAACWAEVACVPRPLHDSSQSGAIDRSQSAGRYEGALRHIIHAFKYEGRRTLGVRLGAVMRQAGSDLLSDADCAVPVPLHPWRHVTRGFNQAADLASRLELPVVHALWRTRATAPQTGLTAIKRRHNVRGAFSLSPLLSHRRHHAMIVNRVVVLVDDVRTTGATLDACAQVLKGAGAREIRALTVAVAEAPETT
ncbi:MAG TPA: ComF family protein [Vicinamibacterales bacterium]|nr:ComF family protein [Vicinamibacterales bacterium]